MSIKISPVPGPLCGKCHFGRLYERYGGQIDVTCHSSGYPNKVHLDIVKCTYFREKNTPTKRELEEVAWTIRTDKSGKILGFQPPDPDN